MLAGQSGPGGLKFVGGARVRVLLERIAMDSRRDFLKKAALLAAGGGLAGSFPSIQQALAIDPAPGSTWLDAEHVVILMQENRSFDHCYGALRGVRGFDDPRAVTLPDGNPVWLQSNRAGETYAPFRLNIRDTKATWMSSLPHSWVDQIDAFNGGRHDGWLDAKRSGNRNYAALPLTLGYYDRRDLPFYYALADAFTVCDQNFCSSLTGTTPNRLHLWTGTIREKPDIHVKANVRNEDVDYDDEAHWTTFPERLQQAGIPWRIYQNEISLASGLRGEADAWLANFTDNPIEWFSQFRVRFGAAHRKFIAERDAALPGEIAQLEAEAASPARDKKLAASRAELASVREERATYTDEAWNRLSTSERALHERAFTTNAGDPDYRRLTTLTYRDGDTERRMQVPKGDTLHQFREDVRTGKLPTVSWIVAPENFSDHPGAPWYGAWYLSECLDILTKNPEVWRKTIFILCYDENDGYFDHIPPFVPPNPDAAGAGKVSAGIDPSPEWVRLAQEDERQKSHPGSAKRSGPIGLGFRVPLVIASPWSRGGYVNSQVCDHTSILQLLERLLSHRTGKSIREPNISAWRRTVCGDLSSVFRPYHGEKLELPQPVQRDPFLGSIHKAQFRQVPDGFRKLSAQDVELARTSPRKAPWLPRQEPGQRPACDLPYDLIVDGQLSADRSAFEIRFQARGAVGAPFHVYAPGKTRSAGATDSPYKSGQTWAYAVKAGDTFSDSWQLAHFYGGNYHLRVHGPNGFYREFRGTSADRALEIGFAQHQLYVSRPVCAHLTLINRDSQPVLLTLEDLSYGRPALEITVPAGGEPKQLTLELRDSQGWYDFAVKIQGEASYFRRYAGHAEGPGSGFSDPLIGRS